jgi:dihydropteroate synthase
MRSSLSKCQNPDRAIEQIPGSKAHQKFEGLPLLRFKARQFEFEFPGPAVVMGIVNVTPDSFSDGGKFFEPQAAIAHAQELARQGAAIIDIGGESSRPQSLPVAEEEELRRVLPVIEQLAGSLSVPISIDTMKVGVAQKALDAGASIINDVGANRTDPAMWHLASASGAGYVCMHMQGTPRSMQINPTYTDVVREVEEFFIARMSQLSDCRIGREQIILDPGIGFGKTTEHNLQLLGALKAFTRLERPLLVGVSRKSFLRKVDAMTDEGVLAAGVACACWAVEAGVQMVRTHDVAQTVQAIRMTEAILARRTV